MAPTKPSVVNVSALQTALDKLTQIQTAMTNSGPADIQQLAGMPSLLNDLVQGDNGMQGNVAQMADAAYGSGLKYMCDAQQSLAGGVTTMVTLLQTTIQQHSTADGDAAHGANNTGTSTSGTSTSGGNATTTTTTQAGGH